MKRFVALHLILLVAFFSVGAVACAGKPVSVLRIHPAHHRGLVFEHGEGRGGVRCLQGAGPAFLTEGQGRDIVEKELRLAGVVVVRDARRVAIAVRQRVWVNVVSDHVSVRRGPEELLELPGQDLVLDGYDEAQKIGYEFVSYNDYVFLGGYNENQGVIRFILGAYDTASSLWNNLAKDVCRESSRERKRFPKELGAWIFVSGCEHMDFRSTAAYIAEKLEAESRGMIVAVFYDPLTHYDTIKRRDSNEDELAAREALARSRVELRRQVRDYVMWLRKHSLLR